MLARLSAFVVWALVAGAIVFWGLRLFVSPTHAPSNAVAVVDAAVAGGDLTRLLGAAPVAVVDAPPPESTRFKLLGVLAPRAVGGATAQPGVALLSVDGKPPRPYRAGARVEDTVYLKEVTLRSASFGPQQGQVAFVLEVPRMPDAATGTLSPVDMSQLGVSPPPPPPAAPPPVPQAQPAVNVDTGEMPPAGPEGSLPGNPVPPMQRGGPGPGTSSGRQ